MAQHRVIIRCLILVIGLVACAQGSGRWKHLKNYHLVPGLDCMKSQFVWNLHYTRSPRFCSMACNYVKDCQAFTVHGGHCRLFVFNKCSKNVRNCNCYRATLLYVKRQPGLKPGALCPADFGHSHCGVKYKFVRPASGRWDSVMAKCSAERGFSIMAEPIDQPKYDYLAKLYDNRFSRPGARSYFLGGSQNPGSPEPKGGWFWHTCRIPINGGLWQRAEPNNAGQEDYACSWRHRFHKMNDCQMVSRGHIDGGFCECLSPFE